MIHAVWEAAQRVLAPGYDAMLRRAVRDHLGTRGTGPWLDAGCGPYARVAGRPRGTLIGIDSDANVLRKAQARGVVCVCASTTAIPFVAGSFDGVVCFGLLHHLNDADAEAALAEMRRVTRPGGMVLLFDSVRPGSAARRPLAALLRSLDRGRHIRTEVELRRLLMAQGFDVEQRITYAWTGLEGCWATLGSVDERANNAGRQGSGSMAR